MDGGVVTFILAILIVAILVFVAILLTGKRGYHFNVEAYQAKFLAIENKLNPQSPAPSSPPTNYSTKLLSKWAYPAKPWATVSKNPAHVSPI